MLNVIHAINISTIFTALALGQLLQLPIFSRAVFELAIVNYSITFIKFSLYSSFPLQKNIYALNKNHENHFSIMNDAAQMLMACISMCLLFGAVASIKFTEIALNKSFIVQRAIVFFCT